jgi:hypothetical protein
MSLSVAARQIFDEDMVSTFKEAGIDNCIGESQILEHPHGQHFWSEPVMPITTPRQWRQRIATARERVPNLTAQRQLHENGDRL